jgi:hypothetical protein
LWALALGSKLSARLPWGHSVLSRLEMALKRRLSVRAIAKSPRATPRGQSGIVAAQTGMIFPRRLASTWMAGKNCRCAWRHIFTALVSVSFHHWKNSRINNDGCPIPESAGAISETS